jgi:iron complex outermembrane receptor protein
MVARGSVRKSWAYGAAPKSLKLAPLYAAMCACIAIQEPANAQDAGLEEVLVTGSRIVRRDFNAPSPILTVGTEVLEQSSSVALETILNQYPQFNPGTTQFTTGELQPTASVTPGAATLNMRGLGANRSLVLLDGRRAQPINAAMTVDINTIPSAAIADVEIITGGAAATYGPDAMAGVVNFKLRRDFEGVNINYQTGVTAAGDGEETRADVLVGGNFNGNRGNAMLSIGYAARDPAWEINRSFYVEGFNDPGTPSNYPRIDYPAYTPAADNLPDQTIVNQVLGTTNNQSRSTDFYINPLDGTVFRPGGAIGYTGPTTFPYKIREHNGNLEQVNPRGYVSTPLTRYSAFGRVVYDLTDNISMFAQGTFVQSDVRTLGPPTPLLNAAVPRQPDIEPYELRLLLDSRPRPEEPWSMSRVSYWFPNRATLNETELNEFVFGLEGSLGQSDWTWEAYSSYGKTTLLTHMENLVYQGPYRFFVSQPNFGRDAQLVMESGNGFSSQTFTCRSGVPIFEPWILGAHGEVIYYNDFELSPDCADALEVRMSQRNVVEQRITEANFQGRLADLRAGELRAAFGVSTRENTSLFEPDQLFLATVPAGGTTDVTELYGEILYPVVGDLELEFGARYSDFETGGFSQDAKSYKALFNWGATDSLRFRGGWQRANRTPNVAELYAGPTRQTTTWAAGDVCRADTTNPWGNVPSNPNRAQVQQLCAELIYKSGGIPGENGFDADRDNFPAGGGVSANVYGLITVGNPRLRAETADTYTFGVIWQAPEANLTLSADWYEIEIADVVGSLGFITAYQQCFNANGTSNPTYSVNNEYCQTIFRNPTTGDADYVEGGNFNLSSRYTTGIDLNVNWRRDMLGGTFAINSALNKLNSWKQPATSDPDAPLLQYAGFGTDFEYQAFTTFSYSTDRLNVGLTWRYLPETKAGGLVQTPDLTTLPTEEYNVFNLYGSWTFGDRVRLRGGVDNVFDTDPPIVGANPANINNPTNAKGVTSPGNYDVLGRRYFVGVAVTF